MSKISGLLGLLALSFVIVNIKAWGSNDKVKLKEIDVLTLYHGRMTTGRRSAPVPQLLCVGGTAAKAFTPQVVQCYNKGSDGFDVQWECKSDMDNAYRFGKVEVVCEGYDYSDDPYILRGSCGLEYTLDFTKEGMAGAQQQHSYYGSDNSQSGSAYGWNPNVYPGKSSQGTGAVTNIACGIVLVLVVYAIYKTCIAPTEATNQRSRTNDDYPDSRGPGTQPPPPGFRSNYYPAGGSDFSAGDSCGAGTSRGAGAGGGGLGGAGGFWTGAATGGLMGYLFGARNNTQGYGYNTYGQRPASYGGFTGGPAPSTSWGGGSSSGFSSGGGSSSTGTRTASGFGGTRRR